MKQLTLDEFQNRIQKGEKKLLKNLQKQLKILSLKAERQAKLNATDYPRVRTGRLRSSITGLVDAKDGRPRVLLRAGGNTSGAPVNYAHFVEFGTKRMRPRLFMGRAVKNVLKDETPKELRNLLKVSLNEGR
jgi:HK97 gp10 family phage protein